ncbi:hypothetical protein H8959_011751 [Pygathrix nigripes]
MVYEVEDLGIHQGSCGPQYEKPNLRELRPEGRCGALGPERARIADHGSLNRSSLAGCTSLSPSTQFFLKNPGSLWILKLSCTVLTMGLMAPVSFSIFPQVGRIHCCSHEEKIQPSTEETEIFYHRGV